MLNDDKVLVQAYKWKRLNKDVTKKAQKVIFSYKAMEIDHATVYFDKTLVVRTTCTKHLGMINLQTKLYSAKTITYYHI